MSKPEETAEREKNAEVIHLKSDVVGAGQAGDVIIHNPDHPNPALRLCRVVPIDAGLLSVIKESVSEEPQEPARRESDQLMPMDAFDAMTEALQPLAHGVRSLLAGADDFSECYA